MNFWQDKMGGSAPEQSDELRADGLGYAARMRGVSSSVMYQLPLLAEQRAQLPHGYEKAPAYSGIEAYANRPAANKYARAAESDQSYVARVQPALRHWDDISEADQAVITAELTKIQSRDSAWSFEDQRTVNDGRSVGMSGEQQLGLRVEAGQRFGHSRELAHDGGLGPAPLAGTRSLVTSAEAYATLRQREQQMQGQPHRVDIRELRSSGRAGGVL